MGAHPGTEKIRSMKLAAICDINEALAKKRWQKSSISIDIMPNFPRC
jgi:hypothetical protein